MGEGGHSPLLPRDNSLGTPCWQHFKIGNRSIWRKSHYLFFKEMNPETTEIHSNDNLDKMTRFMH